MIDISAESAAFSQAVTRYILELGKDARGAVRKQSELLGKRLVQFTPAKTRAQGRKVVDRDIRRAVNPLRPADFKSPVIRKLIRERNLPALEAIFARFDGGMAGYKVRAFSPELHTSKRDRRGRVTRPAKVVTPDAGLVRDYIREVQKRVGRGKGGWVRTITTMGGTVPAWLQPHQVTGTVEDLIESPNPTVRMKNHSEWAGDINADRVLKAALESRQRDVLASIEKAAQKASKTSRLKP